MNEEISKEDLLWAFLFNMVFMFIGFVLGRIS